MGGKGRGGSGNGYIALLVWQNFVILGFNYVVIGQSMCGRGHVAFIPGPREMLKIGRVQYETHISHVQ